MWYDEDDDVGYHQGPEEVSRFLGCAKNRYGYELNW